jgi:putative ABC transport system ATP-binding protein
MAPIITCENLVKIYKLADLEVVALQGLDLTVEKGEMLGVVGTSGSGKTTLLNIVGGLDRPSAGRVTVDGQDLLKLSNGALNRYRRQKVGFVWQQTSRNLIPYLTMTAAGMKRREKQEWTKELLQAVDLYDWRRHRLQQLSGGQQQRVAIAVALANKPAILLGDEPTGEVDSATAQLIMDTFRHLSERLGLTTIIVTHDARIARQVDRVVAIRDGKTSTETVRQVRQLEQAMVGERRSTEAFVPSPGRGAHERLPEDDEEPIHGGGTQDVTFEEFLVLDSAGRLQVPQEYREQYGIGDRARLELVEEGILIRPIARHTDVPGGTGQIGSEEQIAHLFADKEPPDQKGILARLRRRRPNQE